MLVPLDTKTNTMSLLDRVLVGCFFFLIPKMQLTNKATW